MKTRRRAWVSVLIVLAVVITVAVLVFRRNEPEYQGRPLSHWLAKLEFGPPHDPPVPEAEVAVRAIGINALPFLLRSLTVEDSRIKEALIKFDKSQTVIHLGLKSSKAKIEEAAAGYMVLAEIAEPAVPDLVGLIGGPNERASDMAEMVLPYLGAAGIEATVKRLSITISTFRQSAVIDLVMPVRSGDNQRRRQHFTERYREQVDVIVPRLVGLLNDADTNVASYATVALGVLGLRPNEVIPALTNLAANKGAPLEVRERAIVAVGRFGKTAGHVIPFLLTFTNDPNDRIRAASSNALWRIGGGPSNTIDAVK